MSTQSFFVTLDFLLLFLSVSVLGYSCSRQQSPSFAVKRSQISALPSKRAKLDSVERFQAAARRLWAIVVEKNFSALLLVIPQSTTLQDAVLLRERIGSECSADGGDTPAEKMSRRLNPSLQMATTGNPAFSVSIAGADRSFQQYRQGDPLFSPQSFLLAHPPGPYTCLRTVKHRSIAMLSFHLNRLRESAEAIGFEDSVMHEGRHSLERRTVDAVSRTLEAFLAANAALDQACPECMVTVLYVHQAGDGYVENSYPGIRQDSLPSSGNPQPLKILAHAWPLSQTTPESAGPGVEVLIAGSRRSRPQAKHSSWLRDRVHLDMLKVKAGAKEVVLSEIETSREGVARRVLLEGLTSNVFAVEVGTLYTAPTGILLGGMRQLCIETCAEKGFSLNLEPPEVSRAQRWQAAFLTGTGRILEPISAFLFDEDMASEMLGSKRQSSSAVIHREPSIAIKNEISTNGVNGSPDCRGNDIGNSPLWRVEVMGGDQGKSFVQSVRRNMVAALESRATRLL